jgi:hypothetical protein
LRVGRALEDRRERGIPPPQLRLIDLRAVDDRLRREIRVADAEQIPPARAADEDVPLLGALLTPALYCVMNGLDQLIVGAAPPTS